MAVEPFAYKDPDAVLAYGFDWTNWLESGDSVSSVAVAVTAPTGDSTPIVVDSSGVSGAVTSATLSAGTVGNEYLIRFRMTTANSLVDDRTIRIYVKER